MKQSALSMSYEAISLQGLEQDKKSIQYLRNNIEPNSILRFDVDCTDLPSVSIFNKS